MSDINTYANEAAITALSNPINGDLVLNQDNNSVYLCTNAELAGLSRWKKFANDAEAAAYQNRYAMDLDGTDDYIDCGGANDFSFTNSSGSDLPFSISAWVKLHSVAKARVASKDTGTSNREYLFGTNGASRFNMLLGTGTVNLDVANTTTLNTTDWYHVVATYDGSKIAGGLNVYVNGDASSLHNGSLGNYTGMTSNSGSFEIGRFGNAHSFFYGLIDEVAVFNYELTASQVASLSSADNLKPVDISTLSITQPIGWYRMGDDIDRTGTTIKNAANPGTNDGEIENGSDGYTTPTFVDLDATSASVYVA